MSEPSVAQTIARAFHESYERQAPLFGYETREASAVPWESVPTNNKRLMMAVVTDLLDQGVISTADAPETGLTPKVTCH